MALLARGVIFAAIATLAYSANEIIQDNSRAMVVLQGDLNGTIILEKVSRRKGTRLTGEVSGLTPNQLHGFHIHTHAALPSYENGCGAAGGHYNPYGVEHGDPANPDEERHVGALGNIQADATGKATVDITDSQVKLNGRTSVMGRAIVVHGGTDDLGKGEPVASSKANGNAGPRIACGIIGRVPDA